MLGSDVRMAAYPRKQVQVVRVDTSRNRGRDGPTAGNWFVPWTDSSCCRSDMLSERSSLMSTYWPDCTLSTSLRGNGSDAGDKIRPELLTMGVLW